MLVEEIHVRRRSVSEAIEIPVTIKSERARVERTATATVQPLSLRSNRMSRIVTGLFATRAEAEVARARLASTAKVQNARVIARTPPAHLWACRSKQAR